MQFHASNANESDWFIRQGQGQIFTTAVHSGHWIRDTLKPHLNKDPSIYHREEDPLTQILACEGDHIFWTRRSRFDVDLNRPRDRALATAHSQTWNLPIWESSPSETEIDTSQRHHDSFYTLMTQWLDQLIDKHGVILLLDIHSYNHRRNGAEEPPLPQLGNPDIDIGATTLNRHKFGELADTVADCLATQTFSGMTLDVRENIRYPDGGHWPEWVYANYSDYICTMTLEYKKIYMDEWSGQVNLVAVEELRQGLANTIKQVRSIVRELGRS